MNRTIEVFGLEVEIGKPTQEGLIPLARMHQQWLGQELQKEEQQKEQDKIDEQGHLLMMRFLGHFSFTTEKRVQ